MQRIEAADFHELDGVTAPRLSPDGEQVAFVRQSPKDDEEYEATIYIVDTNGGDPRRFTLEEGVDASPRFSPTGDRLAFSSTRGEADDRQQLWILPTDGGEAAQVTDVVGGVTQLAWAPDGERIAFVQQVSEADREEDRDLAVPEEYEPETPDPRVVDRTVYRTGEKYLDDKRSQLYCLELDGELSRLTTDDRDHASPSWGDSETLYYAVDADVPDPDDSLATEIRKYDFETGSSEPIHETTTFQPTLAATADGRIAFPYTDPDEGTMAQTEIHLFDSDDGGCYELTTALDRTLSPGLAPEWDDDETHLYFATPDEGATALWRIEPPATPRDEDATPVPVEAEPERIRRDDWSSISAAHVRNGSVAYVQSGWDHPGDLFVAPTAADSEPKRLTAVNAAYLDEHAVPEPEEIRYPVGEAGEATSDGTCQGWVLTPPEFDPDEKYPLVVEVHGGPHSMWTTSGTMWHEFQTLAARGYVVFWSNPRGSVGYGKSYMQAIERDWGAVTASDVLAGVEELTQRSYVDDDQQFLTGGSFGGYMTAWLVGQTDQFAGAVSQRGVYDLTGFYGSTDWAYKLVEDEFDAVPWEEPAFLQEHSPTGHADQVDTPTLILHSDDDYRTPICTAELFHRILRKHGVDTRLVRYPNEGHELSRSGQPGHIVDRIERIARWFDGYADAHDVPPALEREPDASLSSAAETGEDDETSDAEETES